MSGTFAQEPRSKEAQRLDKLCRMFRNTLRSYPQAKFLHGMGGFGVLLDDGISVWIRFSGDLPALDLRDCLALFATWLVVDPERLVTPADFGEGGVSRMANEHSYYSSGRLS